MQLLPLFFFLFLLVSAAHALTTPTPPKPVLVIGATGKVGRLAVASLSSRGIPCRAFCRDVDKGREILHDYMKQTPNLITLVKGDVTDTESLKEAIMGTQAVLALHGTFCPTPLHKLLIPIYWATHAPLKLGAPPTHPYFTNYVAIQDIVSICEKYEVEKVVRLTGLSCAFPPYNPVSVLFNALLSFSGRYHRMGEEALRSSDKLQSFILRPGGLSDEARDPSKTTIQMDFGGNLPPPGRVGRKDVAEAAVTAVLDSRVQGMGHMVSAIRWVGEVPPKAQGEVGDGGASIDEALGMAFDKGGVCDEPKWGGNYFALFHGIYVYAFFGVLIKAFLGFIRIALNLVRGIV